MFNNYSLLRSLIYFIIEYNKNKFALCIINFNFKFCIIIIVACFYNGNEKKNK